MNDDILELLEKWANSKGISKDVIGKIYDNIDAGDLITLISAFDNKDFDTVSQIYNKTKAEMSANFNNIKESLSNIGIIDLENLYHKLPISSLKTEHLSESHIKTLIYDTIEEGIVSSMNAATASTKVPSTTQNQKNAVSPQQKQQLLKQNNNLKVTSSITGLNVEDEIVGTQFDANPENSLVVVKDPANSNQVKVLNMDDVNIIDQD